MRTFKVRAKIVPDAGVVGTPVPKENGESTQVAVSNKRLPSKFQLSIYEFIKNQVLVMMNHGEPKNLMCKAGAGCGKSTTLVESLKFIPESFQVIFLAFNKDIVEALRPRVPKNCRVQTFHSAGYGALRYRYKKVRVDDKGQKMYNIFWDLINSKKLTRDEAGELFSPFNKLVSLVKNTLVDTNDANLIELIDKHNIDIEDVDENTLFELIREGLRISDSNPYFVDYDDMLRLPVILNLSFFRVDIGFVDETQDLNNAQLRMLQMMIKQGGFIVMVGDPNQAIYGFRGAEVDSMYRMKKELDAEELPLMETYRCGKKIVELAKKLVPDLTAYEGNPEGEVKENLSNDQFYDIVDEGDMVLCRNTAPLIKPAFHLLSLKKKVKIKGRDIGEGLVKLVKKLKAFDIDDFYSKLDKWKEDEEIKARRKKSESMMQTIEDKYDCLSVIAEDCGNVGEIISKIEGIFSDKRAEITFSTVHRSKGLESNRVFILEPDLMPSKWAKKGWQMKEELDVAYVSITRPKTNLYVVGGSLNLDIFAPYIEVM